MIEIAPESKEKAGQGCFQAAAMSAAAQKTAAQKTAAQKMAARSCGRRKRAYWAGPQRSASGGPSGYEKL